jgi:2-oxo-3-hexenedioate decarboxylase
MWAHTVELAVNGRATLDACRFVNPRIEPEIVFKLKAPVPLSNDPIALLSAVEWMVSGFEIVQCYFPEWKFKLPDCTAAFGLHGALVVGASVPDHRRQPRADCRIAAALLPHIVAQQ